MLFLFALSTANTNTYVNLHIISLAFNSDFVYNTPIIKKLRFANFSVRGNNEQILL